MKKVALILAVLLTGIACKRTIHDSGCITRYTGPAAPSYLLHGQLDTIDHLFSANGLSAANVEFTGYYGEPGTDSTGSYWYQAVQATTLLNGLPVFSSYKYWAFKNGIYYTPNGAYNYNPTVADNDTTAHQTLPALRNSFFKIYEAALYVTNRPATSGPLTPYKSHPARPGSYYRDSCLIAQLGYVDASFRGNQVPYNTQWLKVWKISLQSSPSPIVFVLDGTGEGWCYSVYYPGEKFLITLFQ